MELGTFRRNRILAVDHGKKRIGLAVSDPLGVIPRGLPSVEQGTGAIAAIRRIAQEEEAGEIVVGLPLAMDGTAGPAAVEVRAFAERLGKELGLPVHFQDERLTTARAEKILLEGDVPRARRKGLRDRIAAQVILEAFLARRKQEGFVVSNDECRNPNDEGMAKRRRGT